MSYFTNSKRMGSSVLYTFLFMLFALFSPPSWGKTTAVNFGGNDYFTMDMNTVFTGQFSLSQLDGIDGITGVLDVGSTCDDPIVISSFPFNDSGNTGDYGNNVTSLPPLAPGAYQGPGTTTSWGSYISGNDVVYSFTATADGDVTIEADVGSWAGLHVVVDCPSTATVGTHTVSSAGTRSIPLTVEAGTDYFIIISTWATPDSTDYDLTVDGDPVLGPPPACPKPKSLKVAETTATTADISWAQGGTEGGWEVIWGLKNFDVGQIGAEIGFESGLGTMTYQITGLTEGVEYDAYVRADCDMDGASEWTGPVTFRAENSMSYGGGDISTMYVSSTSVNNTTESDCPGTMTIVVPAGKRIASASTTYNMATGSNAWMSEQRSYLYSPTLNDGESSVTNGSGSSEGTYSYPVRDLNFLKGATGTVEVELRAFRTYGGTGCNITYNYVVDGTWELNYAFEDLPSCMEPSGLQVDNLTDTTADVSWTAGGTESAWEIVWGPTGFDPDSGGIDSDTTGSNSYQITGLSATTSYEFYVKAICGPSDESTWSNPKDFKTVCGSVTDFTQNWDGVTTPNLPDCYAKVGTLGSVYTSTSKPASAPNSLYIYATSTVNEPTLALQPVSNAGAGTHWLKFKLIANVTVGGILQAGYLTDPEDASSFVMLEEFTATSLTTHDEYTFIPGNAPGANQVLALRAKGAPANSMLVDDLVWEPMPSCVPPSALKLDSVTENSADISWTPNGTETEWELRYWVTDFDTESSTGISVSVTGGVPEKTLTGLLSNQEYYVYARASCSTSDKSDWIGPLVFNTACTAADIPYALDFDSVPSNEIPNCTSTEVNSGNPWKVYSSSVSGWTGKVLYYQYNSSQVADSWFFTQGVNLEEGVNYQISYEYGNNGYAEKLKVAYGSSPSSASMTEVLDDYSLPASTNHLSDEKTFSVPTDGVYYFGFQAHSNAYAFNLYLDNIEVKEAPTCIKPFDLDVTASFDGAEVTWTAGDTETQWEVIWGESGFSIDDGEEIDSATVGTESYTIENLGSGESYDVYVRAICAVDDLSDWSNKENFTTLLKESTPWTEGFATTTAPTGWSSNFFFSSTLAALLPADGVFMYRNLHSGVQTSSATTVYVGAVADTDRFSLEYKLVNWSSPYAPPASGAADITVEIQVYPNDTWTVLGVESFNGNAGWQEMAFDLVGYDGEIVRFRVTGDWNAGDIYMGLDNFMVAEAPDCDKPTGLNLVSADAEEATVSWTAGGTETEWEISWGTPGYIPGDANEIGTDTSNTESYTMSLDHSTPYDVYVRAVCPVSGYSHWDGPLSFNTLCESVAAPWSEDFESGTNGSVIDLACWDQVRESGAADWKFANANGSGNVTPHGGSLMAEFRIGSTGPISKLITPVIDMTALTTPQLTFYFANENWFGDIDELRVYYKESATDASWTLIPGAVYTDEYDTWEKVEIILPNAAGATDYQIAFEGTSEWARGLNLDDISVDEASVACFTFTNDGGDGDWANDDNWDQGSVPGVDDCVIIPDGMMVYAPVGDLIIEEGGQVTIGSGSTLVVDGDIKNNSGDADAFVLEDGANLLQLDGAVNTGDITALKTFTFSADRKQYNFVISPLVGQSIKNIYLGAEYVIEYHEDDNLFYNAGNGDYDELNPAKGFAIKEAAGGDASQSGTFIGVPYNGNADFTIARSQPGANYGFNLVGNPYPSAINIEQFWDSNSGSIETTFWFWDNRNNIEYEQQGAGYDGSNYATYNADAGEGNPAPTNIGDLDPREPNQYVNVGTAFMLQAKDDKDGAVVTFDNNMRTYTNGTGYFGKGSTADKDVYRLHFTAPSGIQVATTVVYFDGGDDGFASDDSRAFDSSDNIYTVLADDIELVIQGKSAFHVEDVVPLGVKAYTDGIYTISILNQKGIFETGQNIYLRDKQLDIIHNLSEGDYEFMLPAGVNNDRFEVVYEEDGSMGIDDLLANQIIITKDKDEILIASKTDNLLEVQLYDLQGRMVYNNLKVQGKELRIPSKSLGTQVLVAVVKTVKGETLTKKIINR